MTQRAPKRRKTDEPGGAGPAAGAAPAPHGDPSAAALGALFRRLNMSEPDIGAEVHRATVFAAPKAGSEFDKKLKRLMMVMRAINPRLQRTRSAIDQVDYIQRTVNPRLLEFVKETVQAEPPELSNIVAMERAFAKAFPDTRRVLLISRLYAASVWEKRGVWNHELGRQWQREINDLEWVAFKNFGKADKARAATAQDAHRGGKSRKQKKRTRRRTRRKTKTRSKRTRAATRGFRGRSPMSRRHT